MTKRRWNTWVSWLPDHAGFHCGGGRLAVMIDVISVYRPPLTAPSLSDFGTDQPTPSVDPLLRRSATNAGSHPSLSSVCLLRTRHDDPTVLSFPWCSISYLADLIAPRRLRNWSFKALSLRGGAISGFRSHSNLCCKQVECMSHSQMNRPDSQTYLARWRI